MFVRRRRRTRDVLLAALAFTLPSAGSFYDPPSEAVDYVNPLIGNGGDSPNGSGGMIPSTAPPFAMTRWVAQTRQNYVSVTPYDYTDTRIHGFQGTHQPAIWMGESGQVVLVAGVGEVESTFEERGMPFSHESETVTPSYYAVELEAKGGDSIFAEQSATSRVGHLRFTFTSTASPYILIEATRESIIGSADPNNKTSPSGAILIDPSSQEICGSNPERQDFIIDPVSTPATGFHGYFCARFDSPFSAWGVAQNGTTYADQIAGEGNMLSGYVRFSPEVAIVSVRVAVSFISVDQARKNLDSEIPDGVTLEETAKATRTSWAEKLDRVQIQGATEEQKQIFYTGFFHAMQYPYEQSENERYYSGYDDSIHDGYSYTGYSIWDTYRAASAWLILFAPERVPAMITSMLQDYEEGGWLPMWKNIIETNIMISTHADSILAEAAIKGVTGFDMDAAWAALYKDGTQPPLNDHNTSYFDREENVDYEVRAGLSTSYAEKGWVAADIHSEAASRTLDYAYDDYAISVFADHIGKDASIVDFFRSRALESPFKIFNDDTGFMEARNADGTWAGEDAGWTEGDKWAYSFDVVHDVPRLIEKRGGKTSFVESLDAHFDGGHNDHTNEPSHHIPYLYSLADAASKTAERVRSIAREDYNATVNGLSGNEDCGQMSAWYLFSALGFYPVNPVSGEYVIGSPFFDKITLHLPGVKRPLVIMAEGAQQNIYVKKVTVNGVVLHNPIIRHEQFAQGGEIVFEMSNITTNWGSDVSDTTWANDKGRIELRGRDEL